jgi:alpha-tubulin suppressor-like RCC1 family protein
MMPAHDHLSFYRVGGPASDVAAPPVPTGAVEDLRIDPAAAARRMGAAGPDDFGRGGQTGYLLAAAIVQSQPAHIHSVAVSADGRLFGWGCGSDGRLGLRAVGGSKRRLKCYISTPSAVEALEGRVVIAAAAGRHWTIAIVDD